MPLVVPTTGMAGTAVFDSATDQVVVSGGAPSGTVDPYGPGIVTMIDLAGCYAGEQFAFAPLPNHAYQNLILTVALAAPYFAEGRRIATEDGPMPVERLRMGARVALARGGTAEVLWLGHRAVEVARHPRPQDVRPVRIADGAFAPGVPTRDLLLSPDHAVCSTAC